MFDRKELLIIEDSIKDKPLLKKVKSMLYADENLIEELKNRYLHRGLVKIDKSENSNKYYMYFLNVIEDDLEFGIEYDVISFLNDYNDMHGFEYEQPLEIDSLEYESKNDLWFYSGCYEVYVRKDIKQLTE